MHHGPQRQRISREEITRRLVAMRNVTSALADAAPADKATMYGQLGLSLTYHPDARRVDVEAQPMSGMYVKRGTVRESRFGTPQQPRSRKEKPTTPGHRAASAFRLYG
jgi:hypothetical protein